MCLLRNWSIASKLLYCGHIFINSIAKGIIVFNVSGICSDDHFYYIGKLYLLYFSWLVYLEAYQFYLSMLKKLDFCFLDFSYCFSV